MWKAHASVLDCESKLIIFFSFAVYAFTTSATAQSQSIAEVLTSVERVYNSIETWEGEIDILKKDAPLVSGRFCFERNQSGVNSFEGNFYSRLSIPTTATIADEDGKAIETRPHVAIYETLLIGRDLVTVDHSSMRTNIPGFDFGLGIYERPFTLGERKRNDLEDRFSGETYFTPLYLFHGPTPKPQSWAQSWVESPGIVPTLSVTAGPSGGVRINDSEGRLSLEYVRLRSDFVPSRLFTKIGEQTLELTWSWSLFNSTPYPEVFRVKESGGRSNRDITYTIKNAVINEPVSSKRFDVNYMNFVRGDFLADRTSNRLYRYDGSLFVPFEDYGKPERRIQNFGLLLVGLGAVTVISLLFFRVKQGL